MAYADQQMSGNRVFAIIIVALLHVAIGYTLVTGLAYEAAKKVVERVTTIDVEEPEKPEEEPPPPPPEEIPDTAPPPMVVPQPRFTTSTNTATDTTTRPQPRNTQPAQQATKPCFGRQIAVDAVCQEPTKRCWNGSVIKQSETCPAEPPKGVPPKDPTPRGNASRWVTTNDYPSRSLRSEEEGVTSVRLTVSADGRVTNCQVTSSSGSSGLDDATCKNMERRARFNPATDRNGDPVQGTYTQSVRWQIPR